jgi:hypothetical protein
VTIGAASICRRSCPFASGIGRSLKRAEVESDQRAAEYDTVGFDVIEKQKLALMRRFRKRDAPVGAFARFVRFVYVEEVVRASPPAAPNASARHAVSTEPPVGVSGELYIGGAGVARGSTRRRPSFVRPGARLLERGKVTQHQKPRFAGGRRGTKAYYHSGCVNLR